MNQSTLKELFNYQDGGLYWKVSRTNTIKIGQRAGYLRKDNYRVININGKIHLEHRLVWLYHYGHMPVDKIDHIDGNPVNNDISNLRECSQAENLQNLKKPKTNTSGYLGVCFNKKLNKWQANIRHGNKNHHLGLFHTPELAHEAYLNAKSKLHTFQPTVRL